MKFTCNTKPLAEALDLGVINANVSNYHKKSNIVQLTATKTNLVINIESMDIKTEVTLKGSGDSDVTAKLFIGSLLFKNLVSSIDTNLVTLDFQENGLVLEAGKSKFTLPKALDDSDIELDKPVLPDLSATSIEIKQDDWRYIKNNQMYAIAMSFIHPVYTKVWVSDNNDAMVCDFDKSLFTHSNKGSLPSTCLLSDSIVNLFLSIPDATKLYKVDRDYLVVFDNDSYSYRTQFTPTYEEDEGVGSYHAEIFLEKMDHSDNCIKVSASVVSKYLSQATLLSSSGDDAIQLTVEGSNLKLHDSNVDCNCQVEGSAAIPYSMKFNTETLRKVISDYEDSTICISLCAGEDGNEGIIIWNDSLTTLLGCLDEE